MLMRITKWQMAITTISLITGLLLTVTLQAQETIQTNPTSQKGEMLADIAKRLQKETSLLETEIAANRKQLAKRQKERANGGENQLSELQKTLQEAQLKAGLVAVSGPGITFTIDDRNEALDLAKKNGELDVNTNYWPYLVHDSFLRNIVNDLRNAGAEAISINGERIVNTSEIKCGGYIVFVNGQQLSAPYTIQAIGEPDKLESAIISGNTYSILVDTPEAAYPTTLKKMTGNNIQILPYRSSYNLKHAFSETTEEDGGI